MHSAWLHSIYCRLSDGLNKHQISNIVISHLFNLLLHKFWNSKADLNVDYEIVDWESKWRISIFGILQFVAYPYILSMYIHFHNPICWRVYWNILLACGISPSSVHFQGSYRRVSTRGSSWHVSSWYTQLWPWYSLIWLGSEWHSPLFLLRAWIWRKNLTLRAYHCRRS